MHLDYAPRSQLVNWLRNGWSPVPGYEYQPGEYAFLLVQEPIRRSVQSATAIAARLKGPRPVRLPNRAAAHVGRKTYAGKLSAEKWADFRAKLMCEVRP